MFDDDKDTKQQKMADRKQARKRKMKLQDYENSPADETDDAKEMSGKKKFSSGGTVSRGAGCAQRGFNYTIV